MPTPDLPHTASAFVAFMTTIWSSPPATSNPDGSTTIPFPDQHLYNAFSDAIRTARHCGAQFRWPGALHTVIYQFPDGTRVQIDRNGAGCRQIKRHRNAKL